MEKPTRIILILSLLPIVIALFAWLLPIKSDKPSLSFSFNENVKLVADTSISKDGSLEFLYNNEKVSNLVSTKFRIKNNGHRPILESDFIQGLTILFPEDTRVINFELTQVQPLSKLSLFQQGFVVKTKNNQLDFKPVLINPGEIFDLDILSTRDGLIDESISYAKDEVRFAYKIYGVTKIDQLSKILTKLEKREEARQRIDDWKVLYLFILILYVFIIISEFFFNKRGNRINLKFYLTMFAIIIIGALPVIYKAFLLKI